jgi:hypothetical protein
MMRFVRGARTADYFNPFCKRRTQMRYVLGVAAMAAVLWMGTANFAQAQGFG